jgi:hypothetical protein
VRRLGSGLLALSLLTVPLPMCWAAGHSHGGAPQSQGQGKDQQGQNSDADAFDVNATNQVVTKTSTGGIRRVVANDSSDAKQIGLIRANLKKLADSFGPGSFIAPTHGHGPDTPGLAALQAGASGRLRAQYFEVKGGAEVRYSSDDPTLVTALQGWLDAQLPEQMTGMPAEHAEHDQVMTRSQ